MQRRDFVKICAGGMAACGASLAPALASGAAPALRRHNRVRLVDAAGGPLRARDLKTNFSYVFAYPFESTPCFLLNLDRPLTEGVDLKTESGNAYRWPGGVGPTHSIVAYSAICAHKLAYPARQVSFIGFRKDPSPANARPKVIMCCAEKSVYDPFAGARVLAGPAPQPLAAILLEYDASGDTLYAAGTFGGEKFDEFFAKYAFKLSMEMGDRARAEVTGVARVTDMAHFSAQTAQC